MNVGQFLEKWGRTMFERPLATAPDPEEPPELAEIRLAILDQVREKSYRSGGRKVFPYDLLRVELRGVEQSRERHLRRPVLPQIPGAGSPPGAAHGRLPFPGESAGGRGRHGRAAPARRAVAGGGSGVARAAAGDRQVGGAPGSAGRRRQCRRIAARKSAHQHRPRGGRVSRRGPVSPQRSGLRGRHRDQSLGLARARAHPARPP